MHQCGQNQRRDGTQGRNCQSLSLAGWCVLRVLQQVIVRQFSKVEPQNYLADCCKIRNADHGVLWVGKHRLVVFGPVNHPVRPNSAQHTKEEMQQNEDALLNVRRLLQTHRDFPQPGVVFTDIFPVFADHRAVLELVNAIVTQLKTLPKVEVIVGLDSRGFLLGPWIANIMQASFVPVRKVGKLPGLVHQVAYLKEYGSDQFEVQQNAIAKGANVVVIDDVIATGGSALAAQKLVELSGGNTILFVFIIEIVSLNGACKLSAPTYSLIKE